MRVPTAPANTSPGELHRALTEVTTFLTQVHRQGNRHPGFTQDEINAMTATSDLGKTVFNKDTNENNVSHLDGSTVKWRAY